MVGDGYVASEQSYDSVMVDIETTGLDPAHSHILQIAAVRFDLKSQRFDVTDTYNRCLLPVAPGRYWDEGTRQWWNSQKEEVLSDIMFRGEDPALVMKDFATWVGRTDCNGPLQFWSKPISFDYPFIQSYGRQFNVNVPFHYRHAKDLNTFIYAQGHNIDEFWRTVDPIGEAHNALSDVLWQIIGLFKSMEKELV